MILNENVFVKSVILNHIFFVLSDFESKFFRRVRFYINFSTTCQILWNLPKSTTCTFHIAFLHMIMYSYRLQYLHQLDNSVRLRSYIIFCTLFRKDFHFWFRYGVPALDLIDMCKNQLLLIVKLQQLLQSLSHTCLTSFWKTLWWNETR